MGMNIYEKVLLTDMQISVNQIDSGDGVEHDDGFVIFYFKKIPSEQFLSYGEVNPEVCYFFRVKTRTVS